MLFLGPNLTLYRNAPDKRKGCFLAACGFLGLWKSAKVDPEQGRRKGKYQGEEDGQAAPRGEPRNAHRCSSQYKRLNFDLGLWRGNERGSQRNGGLFCRWKLIWAMFTKCSAIPHRCKISLIHMPLIQLSHLSGICGPLGKASAIFYVCDTFKIRWGQTNGKDRLWLKSPGKPPDS